MRTSRLSRISVSRYRDILSGAVPFDDEDMTIFRMAARGDSLVSIAEATHLSESSVSRRVNSILSRI